MSNEITNQPGVITLIINSGTNKGGSSTTWNGILNMGTDIPPQTLLLQGVRIQFASDTDASNCGGVLYLNIKDQFTTTTLIDNNLGICYIPLLVNVTATTLQQTLQIPIKFSHQLHRLLEYELFVISGGVVSQPVNLTSVVVQFQLSETMKSAG